MKTSYQRSHKVAIIGTTAWGTTLGLVLGRKGLDVSLWARSQEEADRINRERENRRHLPGFPFPESLRATASLEQALSGAGMVILAAPAPAMRQNTRLIKGHLAPSMIVINVAKGIEADSGKRMSQVLSEELDQSIHPNICVLSGPNLAQEIARGLPATTMVASRDLAVAQRAQVIMASPVFRVYTNTDVVGAELGGALKNIIALAAGMVDGLGYGDNTKAGLMARGLAEIARLGVAAGANPLTFSGLAGLGDLVATCASPLSRNRFVGQELAKGRSLDEILDGMKGTAEGLNTTRAALKMAAELKVEMPITEQVSRVLFQGVSVRQAVAELMTRGLKHEFEGIRLRDD